MITVLVVDDQHVVRSGLRMLCESADDLEVVGEAANGAEAIAAVERTPPDVVLMDLHMPVRDGIAATGAITEAHRHVRVLVLTTFDDDEHLYPALAAGAHGFLAKDVEPDRLLAGIRGVAADEPVFGADALRRIVTGALDGFQAPTSTIPGLTEREQQVLGLVAAGLSNADIGERLHIGVTTVKTHVTNLLSKTGSTNRLRLAVLAVKAGIA